MLSGTRGCNRLARHRQGCACAGLFLALRAACADPANVTPGATDATRPDPIQLDAIIVTATRREQPLSQVPISIYVLEGDDLAGPDFLDYAPALPGLSFTSLGLSPGHDLAIRGVNTSGGFNEVRPLSAYYFGDTPLSYPVTPSGIIAYDPEVEAIDLDRIELLRGPQGTHFGTHAMGGALRLIPNPPDPSATYGQWGLDLTNLAHGGPGGGAHAIWNTPVAAGRGALRSVAWWRQASGWIDDPARAERDVNGERNAGLRLSGVWDARDGLRLEAGLQAQRRALDGFALDELDEPDFVQTRRVDEFERDRWWLGWLASDWAFDGWRLRSHHARYERGYDADADVSDVTLPAFGIDSDLTARNRSRQHEWIHEVRAHSEGEARPFDWLLGVFFQDRAYHGAQDFPGPGFIADDPARDLGGGSVSWVRTRTDLRQLALFGEVGWALPRGFELALGGRAFRLEDDNHTRAAGILGEADARFGGDQTGFVPRLSLRRELRGGQSLYASAAKGFRPGGANDPAGFDRPECVAELTALGFDAHPASFDSDSLWNYELGAKTHWFGRRLFVNAALFRIDWDDIQTDLALACSGIVFAVNAGAARSQGLDLDLVARLADHLDLGLTASYTRAHFTADLPGLGRGRGVALPGVPRLNYGLSLTWHLPRPGMQLRLDHARVDDSIANPFGDAPLRIGDYRLTHLALSWTAGDWSWQASVHNLFDARAVTGGDIGFLGAYEGVAPPRRLGLSLRREF